MRLSANVTALNCVCPYYTMYPLDFPLRVLKQYGRKNDWVLDPFCGRGTTTFAARLLNMPSIAVDSSPVAAALASAKIATANADQILTEAKCILKNAPSPQQMPSGEFWELAYHKHTLYSLCQLRESLLVDCSTDVRILLRAIILGALHGPRPKREPAYFSNQSPRTFAPKPRYAVKFWKAHGLLPEKIDVVALIYKRALRYLAIPLPLVEGQTYMADSRKKETFSGLPRPKIIITSPPYYGMRTYLPDQWIRLWFMGGSDTVSYTQNDVQLEHSSADHFAAEMKRVWTNLSECAYPGAHLVIRYGGIHRRAVNPLDVLSSSLQDSGWRIMMIQPAASSDMGRRQVRQFQAAPQKPIPENDVYCQLI